MSNLSRALVRSLFGAAAASLVAVFFMAPAAQAADVEWGQLIRYELDTGRNVIRTTTEIEFTNNTPNRVSGGYITRYYYDGFYLNIPDEATGITVEGDAGGVTYEVGAIGSGDYPLTKTLTIEFNRNVFYRGVRNVEVGLDIKAGPPRSDTGTRVNDAYAIFSVFAYSDEGSADIEVVVDKRFRVEILTADNDSGDGRSLFDVAHEGDNTIYRAKDIKDLDEWVATFTLRDDDFLRTLSHEFHGTEIVVKSWPDDPPWSQKVLNVVQEGTPVLADLVGLEWIRDDDLNIIEALEPNLLGFGGWYLTDNNTIEIGEYVDAHLVLHEIGHTWFNGDLFEERWILEGLAETYAEKAVEDASLFQSTDVERPELNGISRMLQFQLAEWDEEMTGTAGDEIRLNFGYRMAWWLVGTLTDEIGFEAMAEVLDAAANHDIAYVGDGPPELVGGANDWRRFLDLIEERGGTDAATDLFVEHVAPEDTDLSERAAARAKYRLLEDSLGDWSMPLYIRKPMSDWDFATATTRMEEAESVVALRDDVYASAAESNAPLVDQTSAVFRDGVDGFAETEATLDQQAGAIENLQAARDAVAEDRGFFETTGLMWFEEAEELASIEEAFGEGDYEVSDSQTAALLTRYDEANDIGVDRVVMATGTFVVVGLILGGVLVLLTRRQRRSGRSSSALDTANADTAEDPDSYSPDSSDTDGVSAPSP